MSDRYAPFVRALRDSVLAGPGVTAATLRRSVHARATASGRGASAPDEVPAELENFVDKVTERAYEVTDRDVEELERGGYSEDAIFEITVSAALGAGLARLERGLAAVSAVESEGDHAS